MAWYPCLIAKDLLLVISMQSGLMLKSNPISNILEAVYRNRRTGRLKYDMPPSILPIGVIWLSFAISYTIELLRKAAAAVLSLSIER